MFGHFRTTLIIWREGESVMHKEFFFFYPCGYTSDGGIATFVFVYVNNKFALLPPPTAALFRHWVPQPKKRALTVG